MAETSSAKKKALEIIEALPARSSWDDILEQLYVRKKIEAGLADADSGRVVSHEEVRRRFARTR